MFMCRLWDAGWLTVLEVASGLWAKEHACLTGSITPRAASSKAPFRGTSCSGWPVAASFNPPVSSGRRGWRNGCPPAR